jgi:hypothetical protein
MCSNGHAINDLGDVALQSEDIIVAAAWHTLFLCKKDATGVYQLGEAWPLPTATEFAKASGISMPGVNGTAQLTIVPAPTWPSVMSTVRLEVPARAPSSTQFPSP